MKFHIDRISAKLVLVKNEITATITVRWEDGTEQTFLSPYLSKDILERSIGNVHSIVSIEVGPSVIIPDERVFEECTNLTEITFPGRVIGWLPRAA